MRILSQRLARCHTQIDSKISAKYFAPNLIILWQLRTHVVHNRLSRIITSFSKWRTQLNNHVQHEQQVTGTPKYVVYVSKVDNLRRVSTPCGLVEISIPDRVRELCEGCFKGRSSLRRVIFGSSSSLERIVVEANYTVY